MSLYTIKYGETLLDVSVKLYGDVTYVYNLVKWNSSLTSISDTNIVGLEIYYEPIIKSSFKPVVTDIKKVEKNVTITDSQTVFDVSLQVYGTIEKAFDLIKLASIDEIGEIELAGVNFSYEYIENKITNYLTNRNLIIATKYPNSNFTFRITESGDFRITENSNNRIIE